MAQSRERIAAVIFDLDGVLIDSESAWEEVKRKVTEEAGGHWHERAQWDMLGMSSLEWSRYMRDELGVPLQPSVISARVADRVAELYASRLPLLPYAVEVVRSLADEWPLAVASSSNRELIDLVLRLAGLDNTFEATVSSEEVERGKPAPDVYLEAARKLGVDPESCAAVEDSANGLRSAHAAGMAVVAIPNRDFPPEAEALALADTVRSSLAELTPDLIRELSPSH
jgi:HAD superfamily hydrolase (TIGR01509 family)